MEFKNKKFIINVHFEKFKDAKEPIEHCYNPETNDIHLNLKYHFKMHKECSREFMIKELRRVVHHELTHWFDYNCWYSWSYKGDNTIEHLATFNELFISEIIEFTDMVIIEIEKKLSKLK